MSDNEDELEEYKQQANLIKDEGNVAFQAGDTELAIKLFTQAIDLDPDNAVFYSNRSAAYMKVDSISKALKDAERCVEVDPKWSKGYNRLGVAQQGLKRFDNAIDTFKKGIELDPNNAALWAALKVCQEAKDADQKQRFATGAAERELEESRILLRTKLKADLQAEKARQEAVDREEEADDMLADFLDEVKPPPPPVAAVAAPQPEHDEGDDDLLAGFFNEVTAPTKPAGGVDAKNGGGEQASSSSSGGGGGEDASGGGGGGMTEKYLNQDLGDGRSQFDRILAKHHVWRNLNPYAVLALGVDATEEDIKYRYKKLSLKVHPDRLRDVSNARDAFEQVKDAYTKLCDEVQRKNFVLHIEAVQDELRKDRRKAVVKGTPEAELPDYDEELNVRCMKHFAEIERMRMRSETNLRAYSARDKMQEAEEVEKNAKYAEFDKSWTEDNRRDKRIGNWRDFQTEPEAKKVKGAHYKEQTRAETKHGVAKVETWKKSWK